jgi:hypothetical protein
MTQTNFTYTDYTFHLNTSNIRVAKSRRVRWVGHGGLMGETENV